MQVRHKSSLIRNKTLAFFVKEFFEKELIKTKEIAINAKP
jgi:hypothetical protein